MSDFDSASALGPIGALDLGALDGISSPAPPALSCAVWKVDSTRSLLYSLDEGVGWTFDDPCPHRCSALLRNAVAHNGQLFMVRSFRAEAPRGGDLSALWISRNVDSLGERCLYQCRSLRLVAFEAHSFLGEIGPEAFYECESLQSIAIPPSVCVCLSDVFQLCRSLASVVFESPSRVPAIENHAFFGCHSLNWLFVPASVERIDGQAFEASGIESIGIANHSVSFKVWDGLLVDFGGGSLVWVIGSAESIVVPASIGELRPFCCNSKRKLRTVEFESDSTLRSIGRFSFASCESLESICIPSSVEVVGEFCCCSCSRLRSLTFGAESKLRLIEKCAFDMCGSLESICVPSSVEVLGKMCLYACSSLRSVTFGAESKLRQIEERVFYLCRSLESICIPSSVEVVCESCFSWCSSLRSVTFGAESKLRLIEERVFEACRSLQSVSVPPSVEVIGQQPVISVSRS
jgi:hypothetical protein